jgi:phage terminase small subunit
MAGKRLNPKQRRFVAEYLVDLNATQAAIRAGYAKKNADVTGPRLLGNVGVSKAVAEGIEKRQERLEVKADDVLRELLRIAMADLGKAYDEHGRLRPIHDIPADTRRAMAGVKVFEEFEGRGEDRVQVGEVREVRFWDKNKALELLGKHLKLFVERMEHTGKDGGPIKTEAQPFDLSRLNDEQLRQYRAIVATADAAPAE